MAWLLRGAVGRAAYTRRVSAREPEPLADDDAEIVDAFPVGVGDDPGPAAPASPGGAPARRAPAASLARTVPVVQAAAVVATGFAAGAVTAAVVRGVGRRRGAKAVAKRQGKAGLPVLGTRSFLVDVHLLSPKD